MPVTAGLVEIADAITADRHLDGSVDIAGGKPVTRGLGAVDVDLDGRLPERGEHRKIGDALHGRQAPETWGTALRPAAAISGLTIASKLHLDDWLHKFQEERREDDSRRFCHNNLSKRLTHQLHQYMAASGPAPSTLNYAKNANCKSGCRRPSNEQLVLSFSALADKSF